MPREICYDVTHLVARLGLTAPTGIDNVDLRFAMHYANARLGPGVLSTKHLPHVIEAGRIKEIVALASRTPWTSGSLETDRNYARVRRILCGQTAAPGPVPEHRTAKPAVSALLAQWWRRRQWRAVKDMTRVPEGAVYLNIAQHMLEHPRYYKWLYQRPDIRAVMFIHDLLPLDFPEFFARKEGELFERRIATAIEHSSAFITSTNAVAKRLAEECRRRGRGDVPILAEPLATTLAEPIERAKLLDHELAASQYFVILGTIEPRKNHLLLLNIWRSLAAGDHPPPKLVVVGARGWGNEHVLDVLDRSSATRPHVIETKALSASGLQRLLANSRALLMPSFEEGYGLPMVEALSIGTPVIACDRPVFKEVTQGCAMLLDPLDGPSWRAAIVGLVARDGEPYTRATALTQRFRPPTWSKYFGTIDSFLQDL
jgi:glycosyltransferase involved in cell wall biosynthesis